MQIMVTFAKGDREKLQKRLQTKKGQKARIFALPATVWVGPYDKAKRARRARMVELFDQHNVLSAFAK